MMARTLVMGLLVCSISVAIPATNASALVPWKLGHLGTELRWPVAYEGGCCITVPVHPTGSVPSGWWGSSADLDAAVGTACLSINAETGGNLTLSQASTTCYPSEKGKISYSGSSESPGANNDPTLAVTTTGIVLGTDKIGAQHIIFYLGHTFYDDQSDEWREDLWYDERLQHVAWHEMGHAIGMDENFSLAGHVMRVTLDPATIISAPAWGDDEKSSILSVYSSVKSVCDSGWGPAYFGDVTAIASEGGGVDLRIQTVFEDNVRDLVIRRAPSDFLPDNAFVPVATLPMEYSEIGAQYSFHDASGALSNCYQLSVTGPGGVVQNRAYITAQSEAELYQDYPPGAQDDLRADSRLRMKTDRWRSVFDSGIPSGTVDHHGEISCDYLVIAYKDFVKDVAPICDYWQFAGLDVELVSCDGEVNTSSQILGLISAAHNRRPLKAVWLVGATARGGGIGFVDLVPTDQEWGDFRYSDLSGDMIIDVPVGRLPASASREVAFYVNKEMRYHWEVSWGGRKDPSRYSRTAVVSVADNLAHGTEADWGAGEMLVRDAGLGLAQRVGELRGASNVYHLQAADLPQWTSGDDRVYHEAITSALRNGLNHGRHVVFGYSLHGSFWDLYGTVPGSRWQQAGVCFPGGLCDRPCETFWINPVCNSLDQRCNARIGQGEPMRLSSWKFEVFELFFSRGLLIFGSYRPVNRVTMSQVGSAMAELVLVEDSELGHAVAVGEAWKQVCNELYSRDVGFRDDLSGFGIFGDPMLFVRGVYDATSGAVDERVGPLAFSSSPNPFNGTIEFQFSGLAGNGGEMTVYDVRGFAVRRFLLPEQVDAATLRWDGRDNDGRAIASGIYVAVAHASGREMSNKIAYLK